MPTEPAASRLTSKGQTTVPARFREVLGLKPGDMVVFEQASGGEVTIRRADATDRAYLEALGGTLTEWASNLDDHAYRDL